jgi:hypothetical protein
MKLVIPLDFSACRSALGGLLEASVRNSVREFNHFNGAAVAVCRLRQLTDEDFSEGIEGMREAAGSDAAVDTDPPLTDAY